MDILRFTTAGNVDDGKSTLIGRLLYDTGNIKSDVLSAVSGENEEGVNINLAHITDGLRGEREQGITIDVAYKYFTTPDRKYIITDAPGHFQYTRNLVTGASGVDAIIILIDAQNGITEQTRRHSLVASFLQIKQVVIAINKMDLVAYDEQVFSKIKNEYLQIGAQLQLHHLTFIPISALCGDNVSVASENMGWYKGHTLMQYLAGCAPFLEHSDLGRFTVQCEIESDMPGLEKGYAGKMLSGELNVGDEVGIYPAGNKTGIWKIINGYHEAATATAGQNITVYLQDNAMVKRGDIISHPQNAPLCNNTFEADVCWLDAATPLKAGKDYFLRINGMETTCKITEVIYKIDISSFEKHSREQAVLANEFARVRIETKDKISYDLFSVLPENGRGIIIDTDTNYTSGALIIQKDDAIMTK